MDDNLSNLRSVEALLGDLQANIVQAQSGDDALRLLLSRDFALILLDIQMPNLDGFETAQLIRARERSRHVPIIFLTALNRSEVNVVKGYGLGAVDFLFKPLVPEILRSKVNVFLDLYRQRKQAQQQDALLRDLERREAERKLEQTRREYEQSLLREEMERERKVKEALAQRADELGRLVAQKEEAEQRNQQLIEELHDRDRRKDEFLAMLAHELRNPMAPIRASLEILRALTAPAEEKSLRALDTADRQVVHMCRLVDDLLDVSRITRGKVELRKAPIALPALVEQAVQAAEPLVRERKHLLSVTLPSQALSLQVDGTRLTQVLANLLHNAAKYTDPGGSLSLGARVLAGQLVISVKDSGIGIAPEMLPRVFDLFVQVAPTSGRATGGLGLGLTLVKSLVEMHDGHVEAHSDGLGRGSEFLIRLPLPPQAPATATERSTAAIRKLPPLDILLIEDNPDIRSSLRDLLELNGHRVEEAQSGERGVELALQSRPTIALVDIGLPGMDGYGVAEALRQRADGHCPRLVALTGYGNAEATERVKAAGFDAHLVKPISFSDLSKVLLTLV
ncbi:MAG: response regulator [Myxococcota bacterium]|nr:response regulator [Myxococcota bacterium]